MANSMNKILVIDTSILCVYLAVPGKATCGSQADLYNKARVEQIITAEEQRGTTLVLPLATLIETGNHIAQASHQRYELAQALSTVLCKALDAQTPWAAFSNLLCEKDNLRRLAHEFPVLAAEKTSIGDATIKQVAEHYAQMGYWVEIFTGDTGLKKYQPAKPSRIPRRKQK